VTTAVITPDIQIPKDVSIGVPESGFNNVHTYPFIYPTAPTTPAPGGSSSPGMLAANPNHGQGGPGEYTRSLILT
jgi:hypothetical protein